MAQSPSWVPIRTRLPKRCAQVPTLLFGGSLVMNSVQLRNVRAADAKVTEIQQWATDNERVTHWLDGVPDPRPYAQGGE